MWLIVLICLVLCYVCALSQTEKSQDALLKAIVDGDLKKVNTILTDHAHLAHSLIGVFGESNEPIRRTTPLHFAVENSNISTVELILERGARVDVVNGAGSTVLGWAVHLNSSSDIVALLLAKGGKEPLILEYHDPAFNQTPLQSSITNKNVELVNILIENKANPNNGDDSNCSLPLTMSVHLKHDPVRCANFSMDDELFVACQTWQRQVYQEIIEILFKQGAKPFKEDGCTNESAAAIAMRLHDKSLMDLFGVKKPSPTTTQKYRSFEEFELFSASKCSILRQRSKSGTQRAFGSVRMIGVDDCAAVCSEIEECSGFNLMLSRASGPRGNGCILKGGSCSILPDEMFAYYKKRPEFFNVTTEEVPEPSKDVSATGPRLTDRGPARSNIPLSRYSNDLYDYMGARSRIYPNSINVRRVSQNRYYQPKNQQSQPTKQTVGCDKIPWYAWVLIGVAVGAIVGSVVYSVVSKKCRPKIGTQSTAPTPEVPTIVSKMEPLPPLPLGKLSFTGASGNAGLPKFSGEDEPQTPRRIKRKPGKSSKEPIRKASSSLAPLSRAGIPIIPKTNSIRSFHKVDIDWGSPRAAPNDDLGSPEDNEKGRLRSPEDAPKGKLESLESAPKGKLGFLESAPKGKLGSPEAFKKGSPKGTDMGDQDCPKSHNSTTCVPLGDKKGSIFKLPSDGDSESGKSTPRKRPLPYMFFSAKSCQDAVDSGAKSSAETSIAMSKYEGPTTPRKKPLVLPDVQLQKKNERKPVARQSGVQTIVHRFGSRRLCWVDYKEFFSTAANKFKWKTSQQKSNKGTLSADEIKTDFELPAKGVDINRKTM